VLLLRLRQRMLYVVHRHPLPCYCSVLLLLMGSVLACLLLLIR
jgi:hypothetical protein